MLVYDDCRVIDWLGTILNKKGAFVLRIISILLVVLIVVTGCQGSEAPDAPPDPLQLLIDAADNIRSSESFRLYVIQQGAPYFFAIAPSVSELMSVRFRLAQAQYVAPDTIFATASIIAGGLTMEVEIYSEGDDQWFRIPALSVPWQNEDFAPGFNPVTLIAEDSGFQAALTALESLEFVGSENLEDGTPVYHLTGTAHGPDVTALVVGLIEAEGTLPVDVYIHRETGYPVRIVLTQPETITEENPDPTRWVIDVFDVNAEPEITPPAPAAAPENIPDAESTPQTES
jgi:hypothetical protein